MIIHSCGSPVHLDVTEAFRLITTPGFTDSGVSVGQCEFMYSQQDVSPKYYCSSCSRNIPMSEVSAVCDSCGEKYPLTETFKIRGAGGIYCRKHAEECSVRVLPSGSTVKRAIKALSEIQSVRLQR